jgi:hypothetical protein
MKKSLLILVFQSLVILYIQAQPVSDFTYKLDNGINVRTENCWDHIWVQQSYAAMNANDKSSPLSVNIRALGDLISGSSFKLLSAGKEVKMQGAVPGTYDLKLTLKLSGKPGTLSCVVGNVVIKPATKTVLSVTMYDYQVLIDETPSSLKGLTSYEMLINRCKGNTVQDIYFGIPTFYAKGKQNTPIPPDEATGNTKGKIKPGTYDLLITIGISGQSHKVWLENFLMKPDVNYKVSINLNAGGIIYTGGNKDVKVLHLYPAGTAAKQTGNPAPVKNLETIKYDGITTAHCCSPGTYDVLLDFRNGAKYEWRQNVVIQTGIRSEIK